MLDLSLRSPNQLRIKKQGLRVDPKITIQYKIGLSGPQMMLALASLGCVLAAWVC
jgi:hypothetical protein